MDCSCASLAWRGAHILFGSLTKPFYSSRCAVELSWLVRTSSSPVAALYLHGRGVHSGHPGSGSGVQMASLHRASSYTPRTVGTRGSLARDSAPPITSLPTSVGTAVSIRKCRNLEIWAAPVREAQPPLRSYESRGRLLQHPVSRWQSLARGP